MSNGEPSKGSQNDDETDSYEMSALDPSGLDHSIVEASEDTEGTPSRVNSTFSLSSPSVSATQLTNEESRSFSSCVEEDGVIFSATGKIKAATLEKLVEYLTSVHYVEHHYLNCFLTSYRYFTTGQRLLELLMDRYESPITSIEKPEDADAITKAVRLKVLNVLKRWLNSFFSDFVKDATLTQNLLEFVSRMESGQHLLLHAKKLFEKAGRETQVETEVTSPKEKPTNIRLLDISDEDFARQLTLIDHKLFRSIQPSEFFYQGWMKPDKEERAPHILACTRNFNLIGTFCASQILKAASNERVQTVEKFISIADKCAALNNFSGAMAVIAGLEKAAVYRLKAVWESVSSKWKRILEDLKTRLSPKKSCKAIRESLKKVAPPCVPYLGMYLTDIVFIEEGNPSYIEEKIHFEKCRLFFTVILDIGTYQQTPYSFVSKGFLDNYIHSLHQDTISDEEMWNLSVEIQPPASGSAGGASAVTATKIKEKSKTKTDLKDGRPDSVVGASRSEGELKDPVAKTVLPSILQEKILQDKETVKQIFMKEMKAQITEEVQCQLKRLMEDQKRLDEERIKDARKEFARLHPFLSPSPMTTEPLRQFLQASYTSKYLSPWTGYDANGIVYGWPDDVVFDVLLGDGSPVVVMACAYPKRTDLATIERFKRLYQELTDEENVSCLIVHLEAEDVVKDLARKRNTLLLQFKVE